ncbi:MAG: hypothetical protein IKT79_05505, partial [Akkermansia sp.]|nr:hypothetical protein [Akkermansia sp.]
MGSVMVAQGATLKINDSYTLHSDDTFKVVYTEGVSAAAVFGSELVLDGGVISFDYRALGESPALDLAGVSLGSSYQGVQIKFTEVSGLTLGKSYTLATGDWSAVLDYISTGDMDCFAADISKSSQGLQVTFGMKDGYIRWDGTAEEHSWTSAQIGTQQVDVLGYHTVVFDNSAANKTVQIADNVEVDSVVFNTTEDYMVESSGGVVTAALLTYNGSGVLTLNGGINVSGETEMNGGTLVLKDTGLVNNAIRGQFSLIIDWAQGKEQFLNMQGVSDLKVLSGILTTSIDSVRGGSPIYLAQQGELKLVMDGDVTLTSSLSAAEGALTKTGTGTLTWAPEKGGFTLGTLTIKEGEFVLSHSSGVASIQQVLGGSSLQKNGSGDLVLGDATLSVLTLKGSGTTTISGAVQASDCLSIGRQSVILVNGADVSTGRFTSGNTANGEASSVVIQEGACLSITGNNDVDATAASFLLAHWKDAPSELVLNGGTLLAENTSMLVGWDSSGAFLANSGQATLKGIRFSSQRHHADSFYLGSAKSGSAVINIGGGGIAGIESNDIVQLGKGTIAATADFVVSGANSLFFVGEGDGTILDTAEHTISVMTAVSGAGNITKLGEGTLSFAGAGADYMGHITVQSGSLQLIGNAVDILAFVSG